ncbi:MerR family transcriptional regulator [Enterocloster clostridioformis]|uniref:DNA-binding transcriptional regulator, MerR family n=1 Tax=Enterocloster clostridioformis TaxID=1531 RepID=A0A1I0FKT3_9FIRM|nr:MerR family transcriptional regulator [Enterocloster clostridioformis]SET58923.1 DNA-binding transcriptional regulator, MerR family [Enterocloster clostridioformis]SEW23587.1 DNA-binding transcriptional regulator, MerR family [Enterocloster clostridioformis]
MNTYKTAEVAAIIGIHPNTVRLYEKLKLIPKPERLANGYRVFTEFHVMQCKLVRIAFQVEILQNGLRKILTKDYLKQLQQERNHAEEAIEIVKTILAGNESENTQCLKRKEVSEILEISMDALRNWEMNGLLTVKRKDNGYRVYTDEDIQRLKIIRSLRCANYSLEAILRLLQQLSKNPDTDIRAALNTPKQTDDIISVCDRLIVSLLSAERNANTLLQMLKEMQIKFL